MPNEEKFAVERQGRGRREDDACKVHEDRLDEIDAEVHKQSGWFKAAGGFLGISLMALGAFNGVILSKLTAIETLLSDSKVVQMQHSEQIKSLTDRVKDIEERHKYIDQNRIK